MKTIETLKQEKQQSFDKLITDCCMFFAFSNEQFEKNKVALENGDKYVSCGAGGYMPKSKVNAYLEGAKTIEKDFKKAVKANKQRKEHILYELKNHEAFYTCSIEDTKDALGEGYTEAEIWEVYKQNINRY